MFEWKRAASKPPYKVSEPSFYRALRTIKKRDLVDHEDSGRNNRYYPNPGPDDDGSGGENRYHGAGPDDSDSDSDFSATTGPDNSESLRTGDSDDSVADTVLTELRVLEAIKDTRGGPWRALKHYREKWNKTRFGYFVASLVNYYGSWDGLSPAEREREAAVVRDALMLEPEG